MIGGMAQLGKWFIDGGMRRGGELAKAIAAGDTAVEEIVRHGAKYLGVAITSAVNLLAPEVERMISPRTPAT